MIKFISQPMRKTQLTRLRQIFKEFQKTGDIKVLFDAVEEVRSKFGEPAEPPLGEVKSAKPLSQKDLRLICFDIISG
jgi:hypothetical protein